MGEIVRQDMDDSEGRAWGELPNPALKVRLAVATSSSTAVSLVQPCQAGLWVSCRLESLGM
jgi:hypothetical protein